MALIIFSDDAEGLSDLQAILDKFETRDVQEETAVNAAEGSFGDVSFGDFVDSMLHSVQIGLEDGLQQDQDAYFEDLLEDDDLRLIVQIRTDDTSPVDDPEDASFPTWADTEIPAEDLDAFRLAYPEQEYRLVAVYDEIVEEVYSVDQQGQSYEDEIGQLKAEILKLKAQLNFVENGGENF